MMNYPPDPSQSDSSFSETFEHLVQIRQALLKLLKSSPIAEDQSQKHTLFSSKRNYRSDELHAGLIKAAHPFRFSVN